MHNIDVKKQQWSLNKTRLSAVALCSSAETQNKLEGAMHSTSAYSTCMRKKEKKNPLLYNETLSLKSSKYWQ